jgi:hypothetical protein
VLFSLNLLTGCAIANRMSGVTETREIQRIGVPASAIVLEIADTGITYNDDPVVRLLVEVRREGEPPYEAVIPKSLVSRVHVPQFQPGMRVPVRIDPKDRMRIALDVYK